MKTLLFLSLIILASCSEDEAPTFNCDQLRSIRDKAYDSWQIVKNENHDLPTLKEASEWGARKDAAFATYLEVEKLIVNNCYNHKTKSDW